LSATAEYPFHISISTAWHAPHPTVPPHSLYMCRRPRGLYVTKRSHGWRYTKYYTRSVQ